jgi:hypothetical protein
VFDKSRGPGGRISTRRAEAWQFDNGAQYFTARDISVFNVHVDEWRDAGVVDVWRGSIAVVGETGPGSVRAADPETRFVGVGGMSGIAHHLAASQDVHYGVRVATRWRTADNWRLEADDGADLGVFRFVVVAIPAPQAVSLLAGLTLEADALSVEMEPSWAVMLGYHERLPVEWDGAFVHGSPLSWVARSSSKPGHPSAEAWVLHASAPWSRAHLEQSADDTTRMLTEAFADATGTRVPQAAFTSAHRWRYAAPTTLAGRSYLADGSLGVLACGDWCGGARIEGAFLSGTAAAGAVLNLL